MNIQIAAKRTFGFVALGAMMIAATSATVLNLKADFKGEWTFSEKKSKMGEGRMRMNASVLKVSEAGDGLTVERTLASPNGESMTMTDKLTFDGKATESTAFGNSKKSTTAAWSSDGESMTVNSTIFFERNGNSMEFKTVETWKLLDGGKSLQIDTKSSSQMGEQNNTFVYDKK